jgi:AraC-like DNA-binding protein
MKHIVLPEIVATGVYNAHLVHRNRTVTKNRTTAMFEIELSLGEGGVSYIDGESHPITEGMVICAKPGQVRHTRLPFRCHYVHAVVKEGAVFDLLSSLPNYIKAEDTKEVREIFAALMEHDRRGTARDEIMLQSLLLRLVYLLGRYAAPRLPYQQHRSNREAIEDTLAYIRENPTAELTLASLSARANFSPVYFHKLFKASTGKNLREYIEEKRVGRAIALLTETEKTLAEIAYECGFSSQSYFSYAFKKRMGTTPREYAKAMLEKYESPGAAPFEDGNM